ncbi:MAG: hypothetical protein JO305_04940 [Alphaproteobacteria bacterium]|nr:hypothetical protein [Alphaproteobacteria bacterium]
MHGSRHGGQMSRRERLERWASVLERCGKSQLAPLLGVEFLCEADRRALRAANSPLAVAYADPVLRGAGLGGDRFGDGLEFFGLSHRQAHRLLCNCGYLGSMTPTEVARRLRAMATRGRLRDWRPQRPAAALARWLSAWQPQAAR